MTNLKISDSKERAGQEVNGTAIRDLRGQHLALEEQCLGQLFKGFFNNKMSVLVFLIQAKQHKPEAGVVTGVCCFLDDLYHHMLADSKQKRFRRKQPLINLHHRHHLLKNPGNSREQSPLKNPKRLRQKIHFQLLNCRKKKFPHARLMCIPLSSLKKSGMSFVHRWRRTLLTFSPH